MCIERGIVRAHLRNRTPDLSPFPIPQEGSFLELMNLVPLGGLALRLKPLATGGLAGWDAVGAAAAREWLGDIARTQVTIIHFVTVIACCFFHVLQ